MKKNLLVAAMLTLGIAAYSQEETAKVDYNRFSIEANGGFSKANNPFADGYYTDIAPLHVDLGVRYMFNTKFGLRLQVGYDNMKGNSESIDFKSNYKNINLQGVVNVGRLLEFETWTKTVGLHFHAGMGYGIVDGNRFDVSDGSISVPLGFTALVRLSDRFALNADFSMYSLTGQDQHNWDGSHPNLEIRGFDASLFNASIGLAFYLGKHDKHADWTYESAMENEKIKALEDRIGDLEAMLVDTDKDGVPDYLDTENNTLAGAVVDTKGRSIDKNNNGIPDDLEIYIDQRVNNNSGEAIDKAVVEKLINEGYIAVFFDFNKSKPTEASTENIAFVMNYLKLNPSKSITVSGYADEVGSAAYNTDISKRRANEVKDILVKAGINASRLNIVGQGEDNSVTKSSADARKLVRKVIFTIK